jgi:NAD-dependent dihydropyrimidine dehydrogenase PreA subunit
MNLRYLSGVTTLEYDEQKCRGCGKCVEVCPHGVFVMENRQAKLADKDACIECGACQKNCPFSAITVRAGVGCAAAIIGSMRSKKAPCCGGGDSGDCCG